MSHAHTHGPESERPDSGSPWAGPEPQSLRSRRRHSVPGARAEFERRQLPDELELPALQRASIAAALLGASSFSAQGEPQQHKLCDYPHRREAHAQWCRRAERIVAMVEQEAQLCAVEASSSQPHGLVQLKRLLNSVPQRWPSASGLARASAALSSSMEACLAEGFAQLLAGDGAAALGVFFALQAPEWEQHSMLQEGIAYAHILMGELPAAQASMERAAELSNARVSAYAWSLNLALSLRLEAATLRAAARLDMMVAATSTEFAACLARMRARRFDELDLTQVAALQKAGKVPFGWAAIDSSLMTQWARESRSSSGRVARAMR